VRSCTDRIIYRNQRLQRSITALHREHTLRVRGASSGDWGLDDLDFDSDSLSLYLSRKSPGAFPLSAVASGSDSALRLRSTSELSVCVSTSYQQVL
jgi:hypothetical protein